MSDYGYVPHPDETAKYCESLPPFGDAVARAVAEDNNQDSFLYRPLVYCLSNCDEQTQARWLIKDGEYIRLKSYNQGSIGSCVGNAEGMCLSLTAALDIIERNEPESFKYMASAEACYGFSREVGGMLGRGDGSYGSAAAKADCDIGTLWQTNYLANYDLTEYSVSRCREWGYSGVPRELKSLASEHKLFSSYRVNNADEAWGLIGAGYPINQCSGLGWSSTRDNEGACRQTGSWAHSMCICGRRTTQAGNKLFLIINSWGDGWCKGSLFEDQPPGSFYASYESIDSAMKQNDSFVKININGIQRKQIDWGDW